VQSAPSLKLTPSTAYSVARTTRASPPVKQIQAAEFRGTYLPLAARRTSARNAPLNGNSDLTGNTPGSIGQVLNLAAGSYELGLYLSGSSANLPLEKVIRVEAGGTSNLFSYTLPTGVLNQAAPYSLDYEYKTFRFQALGPMQLVFASLDEGPSLGGGGVVGNVTVVPVSMPVAEPSTAVMMLAGLMSLLLVRRRSAQDHLGQR
jgi:hypothetical protein